MVARKGGNLVRFFSHGPIETSGSDDITLQIKQQGVRFTWRCPMPWKQFLGVLASSNSSWAKVKILEPRWDPGTGAWLSLAAMTQRVNVYFLIRPRLLESKSLGLFFEIFTDCPADFDLTRAFSPLVSRIAFARTAPSPSRCSHLTLKRAATQWFFPRWGFFLCSTLPPFFLLNMTFFLSNKTEADSYADGNGW